MYASMHVIIVATGANHLNFQVVNVYVSTKYCIDGPCTFLVFQQPSTPIMDGRARTVQCAISWKRSWQKYTAWLLLGASMLCVCTQGHPQCLDFLPPFEVIDDELPFCSLYTELGCCTHEDGKRLQNLYTDVVKNAQNSIEDISSCVNYVKDILCQECSPYAVHIFSAEDTRTKRAFPGLCTSYCRDFYDRCKDVVPLITTDDEVVQSLSSRERFCEAIAPSDVDYCYPDLLSNEILIANITRTPTTTPECLCVQEFASNLRNALLFVTPNDGTGRIFVAEQIGVVHIYYKNGSRLQDPFMDVSHMVLLDARRGDERGFLALAFHPNFRQNGKLYIYLSIRGQNQIHKTRISEFRTMVRDDNKVDPDSERILLEIQQPYPNQNGGAVSLLSFIGGLCNAIYLQSAQT